MGVVWLVRIDSHTHALVCKHTQKNTGVTCKLYSPTTALASGAGGLNRPASAAL